MTQGYFPHGNSLRSVTRVSGSWFLPPDVAGGGDMQQQQHGCNVHHFRLSSSEPGLKLRMQHIVSAVVTFIGLLIVPEIFTVDDVLPVHSSMCRPQKLLPLLRLRQKFWQRRASRGQLGSPAAAAEASKRVK